MYEIIEKTINNLKEVKEYIRNTHTTASKKVRMMDYIDLAVTLLKEQENKIDDLK